MESIIFTDDEAIMALRDVYLRLNQKIVETGFDPKYMDGLMEAIRIVRETINDRKTD